MNIKTLAAIAALAPALALASPNCEAVGKFAEAAMNERQSGTSLTSLLSRTTCGALCNEIVMSAYEVSRYTSAEYKLRAAQDHRNKYELQCLHGKL